jgi:hypothetical protein
MEEIRERKVLGAFMPNFLPDDTEQAEIGNRFVVPHVFTEVELILMS